MSASTARAERRELQRTLGPQITSMLRETQQAVQELQARVTLVTQQAAGDSTDLHRQLETAVRRLDALEVAIAQVHEDLGALEAWTPFIATFRGRLRWLLTGR